MSISVENWLEEITYSPTKEEVLFSLSKVKEGLEQAALLNQQFVLNLTNSTVTVKWEGDNVMTYLDAGKLAYGTPIGVSHPSSQYGAYRIKGLKDRFGVVIDHDGIHSVLVAEVLSDVGVAPVSLGDVGESWQDLLTYEAPNTKVVCMETGLYFKTVPNKQKIKVYSSGAIDTGFEVYDTFLKPDQELEYIELGDYLYADHNFSGRRWKGSGFTFKVKAEVYDGSGKSKGMKTIWVDEQDVVKTDQYRFYRELDQQATDWMDTPSGAPQLTNEEKAMVILQNIVDDKNLNLIFDPAQMAGNYKRIFIGSGTTKVPAETSIGSIYGTGGAGISVNIEDDGSQIQSLKAQHADPVDSSKSAEYFFKRIDIHFPYYEALRIGFPGDNQGTHEINDFSPYPNFIYLNRLELMLAHELIHAHQNLIDPSRQGNRDYGVVEVEDYDRRCFREVMAYHFCIFPNKRYAQAIDDPVFKYTDFERGVSATFGNIKEHDVVFWIWKIHQYIVHLRAQAHVTIPNDIEELITDVEELMACYERQGYQFFREDGSYSGDQNDFKMWNHHKWNSDVSFTDNPSTDASEE